MKEIQYLLKYLFQYIPVYQLPDKYCMGGSVIIASFLGIRLFYVGTEKLGRWEIGVSLFSMIEILGGVSLTYV